MWKILLAIFCLSSLSSAKDCSWMKKRLVGRRKSQGTSEEVINRIYPWARDLETLVNFQIRIEMNAFYNYLAMSHFFGREDQNLEGFAKFYHGQAMEELKHAESFMKYQAKRGGRVSYYDLPAPEKQEWENGVHTLKMALLLERNVTSEILCLHQMANKYDDVDFVNFLEGEVIPEQYESMKELATHIKTISRMSSGKSQDDYRNYGLAEAEFDKVLKN